MKTWFNVVAKADNEVEISIFDEIGAWGVNAKDFIAALKPHKGKNLTCLINSPGGSVFDALAMYNVLRANGGTVTTKVLGVAASAASLVAMAGDKIIMPENTFMMIHNPWAFAAGNAEELRDFADTLDTIGSSLTKTYVARTGLPEEEVKALLDNETWLTAEEALAKGFATEIEASLKIAASYDVDRFPDNIKALFAATDLPNGDGITADPKAAVVTVTVEETETSPDGETETTTTTVTTWSGDATDTADSNTETEADDPAQATLTGEIQAYAAEVGMPQFASIVALDSSVKTIADAKAKFTRAREITALCGIVGKEEMADDLIRKGVDIDSARAALSDALAAEADALATSSVRPVTSSPNSPAGGDVWAKILPNRRA